MNIQDKLRWALLVVACALVVLGLVNMTINLGNRDLIEKSNREDAVRWEMLQKQNPTLKVPTPSEKAAPPAKP